MGNPTTAKDQWVPVLAEMEIQFSELVKGASNLEVASIGELTWGCLLADVALLVNSRDFGRTRVPLLGFIEEAHRCTLELKAQGQSSLDWLGGEPVLELCLKDGVLELQCQPDGMRETTTVAEWEQAVEEATHAAASVLEVTFPELLRNPAYHRWKEFLRRPRGL